MSKNNVNHSNNVISNRTTMTTRTKSKITHSFKSSRVKLDKYQFSVVDTTTIKCIVKVNIDKTHANVNITSLMNYNNISFIIFLSD